jgi:hypothetical protein
MLPKSRFEEMLMIPINSQELGQFREFIAERCAKGEAAISPEEALDEWRASNPTAEELAESTTAVRKALADMEAGDAGQLLEVALAEIRDRHGLNE